jgi:hypothetical protein
MPHLKRFIHRTRRRWIAWRIIECAGISAAMSSGIGFILIAIMLWQSQSAVAMTTLLLCLGLGAGTIWALLHRPTFLQTAIEVDRQLNLGDLLSSALQIDSTCDDAFASVVMTQAESRCREISPNQLILRRLGSRAWGGIGLAGALLITLAMFSSQPIVSEARSQIGAGKSTGSEAIAQTGNPSIAISQMQSNPATDHPLENQSSSEAQQSSSLDRVSNKKHETALNGTENNSGASTGRSNDSRIEPLKKFGDGAINNGSSSDSSAGGGKFAAAGGHDNGPDNSSSGIETNRRSVAPWQSSDWPNDRAAAQREVENNAIPDGYRDLVREYFDLPPQ